MSARYPGKIIIGLTGNIAVGKSLVRRLLAELGAATIDADQVAHDVIKPGQCAYQPIIAAFGAGILGADGQIMRPALGKIVFADPAQLRKLEAITHPVIRQRIHQRIRESKAPVVVIEAIKLLEGELKNVVDAVWVVDATPAAQLRRLIQERGFDESHARQRIAAQNDQAEKLRQADVVISNDGDIEAARSQVLRHWQALMDRSKCGQVVKR